MSVVNACMTVAVSLACLLFGGVAFRYTYLIKRERVNVDPRSILAYTRLIPVSGVFFVCSAIFFVANSACLTVGVHFAHPRSVIVIGLVAGITFLLGANIFYLIHDFRKEPVSKTTVRHFGARLFRGEFLQNMPQGRKLLKEEFLCLVTFLPLLVSLWFGLLYYRAVGTR